MNPFILIYRLSCDSLLHLSVLLMLLPLCLAGHSAVFFPASRELPPPKSCLTVPLQTPITPRCCQMFLVGNQEMPGLLHADSNTDPNVPFCVLDIMTSQNRVDGTEWPFHISQCVCSHIASEVFIHPHVSALP